MLTAVLCRVRRRCRGGQRQGTLTPTLLGRRCRFLRSSLWRKLMRREMRIGLLGDVTCLLSGLTLDSEALYSWGWTESRQSANRTVKSLKHNSRFRCDVVVLLKHSARCSQRTMTTSPRKGKYNMRASFSPTHSTGAGSRTSRTATARRGLLNN